MCRIAGWLSVNKSKNICPTILSKMKDSMTPGGPDASGLWIDDGQKIGLAHRRLSILDLSEAGAQPMRSYTERFVVTYNGEIYNFVKIRDELQQLGVTFSGNSDTEVLVNAFEVWGIDCVKRFHGMFAFGIWDRRDRVLTLVRDRIGVKPLYYGFQDDNFYFSSELKGIMSNSQFRRELDMHALELFLKFSYVPAPYAILQDCNKLEAGSWLRIDSVGNVQTGKWWDPSSVGVDIDWTDETLVKKELRLRLAESTELRLVSDVPVGMFFSGGIDSSLLLGVLRRELGKDISTFTIGFDEGEYNEAHHAKSVASYLGSDHHELYLSPSAGLELIDDLPEIWDEPFGDASAIATHLVSKFARQSVKVALSADGGDELFCGYPKYWLSVDRLSSLNSNGLVRNLIARTPDYLLEAAGRMRFGNKLLKIKEIEKSYHAKEISTFMLSQHVFSEYQIRLLIGDSHLGAEEKLLRMNLLPNDKTFLQRMLLQDLKTYHADDIHVKVDRASMANSLEAREPLLDQSIVEFALAMPTNYKINGSDPNTSKRILRELLSEYVPEKLTDRPKMGFGVPLDHWLNNQLKDLVKDSLDFNKLSREGIINPNYVEKLLISFRKNPKREVNKIWNLIVFQRWKERWIESA